jgi:hypothetical protein
VVTQFHVGGNANNHPAIFAKYAASGRWSARRPVRVRRDPDRGPALPVLRIGCSGWVGEMGGSIRCRFCGGGAGAVRRPPGRGRRRKQAGRCRVGQRRRL